MIHITFTGEKRFEALRAAEFWCAELGVSVGSMQEDAPRGLMWGEVAIPKWRSLTVQLELGLDGRMTGNMQYGPIEVEIKDPRRLYEISAARTASLAEAIRRLNLIAGPR